MVAYEDEPLSEIVRRLAIRDIHKLPVVSRTEPRRFLGSIRREDIVKAYNIALAKRQDSETNMERLPKVSNSSMVFVNIELDAESRVAHQTLASVAQDLPYECVVVSIRRQGVLLVPHGNTIFKPGDVLNVFARQEDQEMLWDCFSTPAKKEP